MNAHTYAAETRIHQSLKAHSYLKLEGIEVKRKKMERIKRSILTDVLLDIRLQRRSVSLYLKCVFIFKVCFSFICNIFKDWEDYVFISPLTG